MPSPEKNYRLSVLLVTYNHERYIHQALQMLLKQQVDASVELVVADDQSSDATLEIIREYENKDARFHFKYLDSTTNLGVTRNYERAFAACTGTYVAVLEGDDYWVCPTKLKRQIDFLEAHWECDLCSVNYFVYVEDRSQFTARTAIGTGYRLVSARELIADNIVGNFSTCMYRKSALDALPHDLFRLKSYDWIVNICIARQSLIGFLEEPMSVYRLHSSGAWTQTSHIEKLQFQFDVIPAYDALTDFVFHEDFEKLANRLKHMIAASQFSRSVEPLSSPIIRALPRLADFMPPVLIVIMRGLLPPVLKHFLARHILRRYSA